MKFKKLRDVNSPNRANWNDSGIDFYIPNDNDNITIAPQERVLIDLGIAIELPQGYDLQFVDKSGISSKTGLKVLGGLIDNGYRGGLKVCLVNTGLEPVRLNAGQKVTQGVIREVEYIMPEEVKEINSDTDRGEGGFGSTGLYNEKNWDKV